VYVASAGPFHCGCIQYSTEEISVVMIVAIVILLGVPLILLLIVGVVYICQRRPWHRAKHRHAVTDSNDNDDVEMASVLATSTGHLATEW